MGKRPFAGAGVELDICAPQYPAGQDSLSMSGSSARKLKSVEARPGYRLAVVWENGPRTVVDLSEDIKKGGVFNILRDEGKFSQVSVDEFGHTIQWEDPKDENGFPVIVIDSEALRQLAIRQHDLQARNRFIHALKVFSRSSQS